ncbi:phosphoribosylamine--glycine ligase [Alkaliphilus sp. B6464]|uniref:phosphoribosylamine--glycine ligase n=1 Tax=Alkaliphilus sp. B6464 TaxID=2731219 RepID=UPI001BA66864|nr:phosphoribosylamine--glycine ligase [Alkaliphilus sp. B6464]QUH19936.1 phosphoribosylamine--glycine ligase [Alkaliphilus sp. B6464]
MKLLVIGGGGREHAIVWKLSQSPLVTEIFCAPGNAGIGKIAKNVDISSNNIDKLVEFSLEMNIDLIIVGPEEPLVEGIVDTFRQNNLKVIGPTKQAAQLEGSKAFAKDFMKKYDIPTAQYHEVTTFEEAKLVIEGYSYPVVVKADGLAAGKGVFICENKEEALSVIKQLLDDKILGDAGKSIVIEEFLKGTETSILCFIDGHTIIPMVSSQDHKRAFDGDNGPNTGGMGTYSPNYVYTEEIAKQVEKEILYPTLIGIQQEKMDYRGIIFIGLMITEDGPKVLEYNVRFGDPETQVVLPRLKTDLIEIFDNIIDRKLEDTDIQWSEDGVVCVILASGGYPNKYENGLEITGLDTIENELLIFHSGTIENENKIVTKGGRVLGVVGIDKNVQEAREKVYANIDKIRFKGSFYRKDIGIK